MANITVTNDRYTAESVYQWDINQTLVIYGLSLAKVPEIHFSNLAMDRAVVRQATMDEKGVISVDIPNAMLQKPLEIVVHICMYEGDTFETLYKMSIPVKARKKPADYTIEDDEDIYSFNALENLVTNALIRVDTELSEAKTTLATAEKRYNDTVATITDIVDDSVDTAVGNLLDTTLSVEGKAGESKAVGEALAVLKNELNEKSRIETGCYTGDGTEDRIISLSTTPKAVLVMTDYGDMYDNGSGTQNYHRGGLAVTENACTYKSGNQEVISIVDNGFKVTDKEISGYQDTISTNSQSQIYNYVAFV